MASLWTRPAPGAWRDALASYEEVLTQQGVAKLPERDRWYREELPAAIEARRQRHVTLAELVRITEWKMARGVWRARNLILVRSNDAAAVRDASAAALARVPDPTAPIAALAELSGVGPATASAVLAAAAPSIYPFFDELVAGQIPALGKIAFTLGYYARYADALRQRALHLGPGWTPVMVERALWAHVGGKAGAT
jgi:hypothetical protein